MSEEISYTKRYVYNLDPAILDSLKTLYFDSQTFEQRSYEDFIKRRGDEIVKSISDEKLSTSPVIVQPKPRINRDEINTALSNLKISKSEEYENKDESGKDDKGIDSDNESESDSESESESESNIEEKTLETISEATNTNISNDDYESTISFMSTKSPLVLFESRILNNLTKGKVFGVYKTTINAKDSPNYDALKMIREMSHNTDNPMPKDPKIAGMSAVFMLSSGHFAGAIISHLPHSTKGNKGSNEELQLQSVRLFAHKTFHRYTTRRKQGGSQSAMDDSKGKANSAGSTLRRYNEQALGKDVEGLMDEWKPLLDQCESIFIRGSGKGGKNARGIGLIIRDAKDPKAIIKHGDSRVKMIPFGTKRPTTMEIKRAWCELMYLKIVDMPEVERDLINKRMKRDEMLNKSKESKDNKNGLDEENIKLTNEIISLLKKSKAPGLVLFFKKNKSKLDVNFRLQPVEQYKATPTALHYASRKGLSYMVQTLLVQLHADASILNNQDKTAYEIALDKDTKYSFRLSRSLIGEDKVDWEKTHIGAPMTKEEVEEVKLQQRNKEEKEKAAELNQLKEQHENIVDEIRKEEAQKNKRVGSYSNLINGPGITKVTEEQKLSGLSDAQRMKVLREQRFRAIEARLNKGV